MSTYGSLFTGIGGLDLALEAFGHRPLWQAEMDPYARAVLAKHWPGVHCYRDVREIDATSPPPDIICGGFPCQDISNAGKRVGIDGERSGLWSEFARIIRDLRPRVVFVENVAALTVRGLDRVLGDLAALGFDAEWEVFRASDVGAPHLRARLFILAYADRDALRQFAERDQRRGWRVRAAECGDAEDARANRGDEGAREAAQGRRPAGSEQPQRGGGEHVADANLVGRFAGKRDISAGESDADGRGARDLADSDGGGCEVERGTERDSGAREFEDAYGDEPDGCSGSRRGHRFPPGPSGIGGWNGPQPAIRRGDDGVPGRIHRLRLLGNAVVWQQAALALGTLAARATATERAA